MFFFSTRSSRLLRKRLFLVEKLKDADTVGLVVGSVGVDKHREAVKRMRELCKQAGKKIYVISVGKVCLLVIQNQFINLFRSTFRSCPTFPLTSMFSCSFPVHSASFSTLLTTSDQLFHSSKQKYGSRFFFNLA